jgi:hypothetical protein
MPDSLLPAVAQNAIRLMLAGLPAHMNEALAELDIEDLRRLNQACHAVTSASAQRIVTLAVERKRTSRG